MNGPNPRDWMAFKKLSKAIFFILLISFPGYGQEHHWHSHAQIVKKVIKKFKDLKSYSADFRILTQSGKRIRQMNGRIYYKKPDKVRFAFSNPAGNLMVSDGRMLWVYIRRLNAAGRQDLRLNKKDESGRSIFAKNPTPGLSRLFRKYHYHFDTTEQPRQVDGNSVFVLDMTQREKIGGYEKITLFVDSSSYLIRKAIAADSYGKITTISFSNTRLNIPLDGKLFQFKPGSRIRVIDNPLVNE